MEVVLLDIFESIRWVPLIEHIEALAALAPVREERVGSQYRSYGEPCLQGSCAALHGSTSIRSSQGDFRLPAIAIGTWVYLYSASPRSLRLRT